MSFLDKYKKELEQYDKMEKDFIDDDLIWKQLNAAENPTKEQVRKVLQKADNCIRLEPEETAILIQNKDPETIEEMYQLANKLKHEVYADRLVLFAPLYCSDECENKCKYCGFRCDNGVMKRKTLTLTLCLLALVALFSVGFAAWVVTAPINDTDASGNFVVEEVSDERVTLTATIAAFVFAAF